MRCNEFWRKTCTTLIAYDKRLNGARWGYLVCMSAPVGSAVLPTGVIFSPHASVHSFICLSLTRIQSPVKTLHLLAVYLHVRFSGSFWRTTFTPKRKTSTALFRYSTPGKNSYREHQMYPAASFRWKSDYLNKMYILQEKYKNFPVKKSK